MTAQRTVIAHMTAGVATLRDPIESLFLTHSRTRQWDTEGIIYIGPDHSFEPLSEEAQRLQSWILREYNRLTDSMRALLVERPEHERVRFAEYETRVRSLLGQGEAQWIGDLRELHRSAWEAIEAQLALLNALHDPTEGAHVFVPDTNALYWNPALETWRFPGAEPFSVILTPAVLADLDRHKIEHKNPDVRGKAERLIRGVKEFRRRGSLIDGVTIVAGVSSLAALAIEPRMADSLPWLDASNDDDRVLASVVEVMRLRARSEVVLVTRDINMQNKAEFARIRFTEPPDP